MTEFEDLEGALDRATSAVEDRLIRWRRHVHQHPELPNREERTAAFVADRLREAGLDEIRTDLAGHGVIGILRGGRPGDRVMALRADLDALPVAEASGEPFASTVVDDAYPGGPFPVAHACGHDAHIAVVLAAAHVLAAVRDRLPGTVMFVFQPAEEGPPAGESGGAQAMLDAGAFDDPTPTMVFGMHVGPMPKGVIAYRIGNQFAASCRFRITLTGRQVHGSMPWMGIDPMPAVGGILIGIGQLYRQVPATDAVTVTIGHIEDVGRYNIIGDCVTLWGTIRCIDQRDMSTAQERLTNLAEGQGRSYGCGTDVFFDQVVSPVHNAREWIDTLMPTLRKVVGPEKVVAAPPSLAYDDVAEFVKAFGGAYLSIGVQDAHFDGDDIVPDEGGRGIVANHNPGFYVDEGTLLTAVRVDVRVAVDHLLGRITPAG